MAGDDYRLDVPRPLAEEYATYAEQEGLGSVAAAMKFALRDHLDRWRARKMLGKLLEGEVELPEGVELEDLIDL